MAEHAINALIETVRNESIDGALLLKNPGDNPVCSVTYDEKLSCIRIVWHKYATSSQFRLLHELMLQMMEKYDARKILGDDRHLPIVHAEDQLWIIEDWLPRARGRRFGRCSGSNFILVFRKAFDWKHSPKAGQ